jgi:hypothetical protein
MCRKEGSGGGSRTATPTRSSTAAMTQKQAQQGFTMTFQGAEATAAKKWAASELEVAIQKENHCCRPLLTEPMWSFVSTKKNGGHGR